jgi:hypothetical protein
MMFLFEGAYGCAHACTHSSEWPHTDILFAFGSLDAARLPPALLHAIAFVLTHDLID